MTKEDFRQIALNLSEVTVGAHRGHADFRVAGKIFASLYAEEQGYATVFLSEDQQTEFLAQAPAVFLAVPEAEGRKGETLITLAPATPDLVEAAMKAAWQRRKHERPSSKA